MDLIVFSAVLASAACHAGWNALLKLKLEPVSATALVAMASGLIAVPAALAAGLPRAAAWPYLTGSVIIHIGYFLTLAEAYRSGDLGQVYPIARGAAPLMTAILATLWLHETLGLYGWAGIILLAAGILLLALRGGRPTAQLDVRSIGFALLTSLTITAYTLVDGMGARLAGTALAYSAWLFLLSGIVMAVYGFLRVGRRLAGDFLTNWPMAVAGGALSIAAYAIAIWAMTVAPIALVAALRETSVLFGALFATLLLREPWLLARITAAVMVLAGALLLRVR
ncbi:MAG: EamA family transporter [Hyphomonadaceae bacterium]|jgi:drug/metabolite transporter (DMT)-like permease|nr:EamA family transporter [Hyphomonadaceae bacterium]